jgi:hypothetical protein
MGNLQLPSNRYLIKALANVSHLQSDLPNIYLIKALANLSHLQSDLPNRYLIKALANLSHLQSDLPNTNNNKRTNEPIASTIGSTDTHNYNNTTTSQDQHQSGHTPNYRTSHHSLGGGKLTGQPVARISNTSLGGTEGNQAIVRHSQQFKSTLSRQLGYYKALIETKSRC